MKIYRFLAMALLTSLSIPTFAQTCASPIEITTAINVSGSTCSGSKQLPSLANGAIAGTDHQIIFHASFANSNASSFVLHPDTGQDMALFVCPNQCSPLATCIAAVDENADGGVETAPIPDGPGDYFVIVQSTGATCGGYTLNILAPLDD
jgi:hypothetical protein